MPIRPPWTITSPSSLVDSFGRPRVSEPKIFFNSDFGYDINPLWYVESLTGTGSVVKTSGESTVTLSTGGTASGSGAIYQTKTYFRYEPGKGRFVLMSGNLGAQVANVRSRMGNFDANNGAFFEMDGTLGPSVNLRSNVSGSVVDTKILQASWNLDQMNGQGPSGVTLNFNTLLIFWLEENCSGVGCVRYGFIVNGTVVACHEIYNDNLYTYLSTNTLTLPLRSEIVNTGVTSGTNTVKSVIMALSNEGGGEIIPSYIHYAATNGASVTAVGATPVPIVSIQPKLLFAGQTNRIHVILDKFGAWTASAPVLLELIYNGTLTGANFSSVDTSSGMTFDTSATTLTGGIVVHQTYAVPGNNPETELDLKDSVVLPLTLDINGANPDTWTVVAQAVPSSTAATCTATLTSAAWNAVAVELMGTAAVGGGHNAESAGATTLSVTYSPTAGNAAVVVLNTGAAVTNLFVKDNLNNILSAGPVSGNLASFYQFPVPSGVTSYTATWITSRQASIVVEEYSGVTGINATLTGNTNTGSSTTATITTTMDRSVATLVVGFGNNSSDTMTGTVGNQRQQVLGSSTTAPVTLMDNVPVVGTAFVSGKISWIELR